MARPRKSTSADNKTFGNFEFANIEFTPAMREAFMVWYKAGPQHLPDLLYTCLESGCKVSFSQNSETGVYRLSITVKDAGKTNSGVVYQLQHSDLSKLGAMGIWTWTEIISEGHVQLNGDQFDW